MSGIGLAFNINPWKPEDGPCGSCRPCLSYLSAMRMVKASDLGVGGEYVGSRPKCERILYAEQAAVRSAEIEASRGYR